MSDINQTLSSGLDTSPPNTTTQHSHTSGSDHETDSNKEDDAGVNQDTMVVDEEVPAGDNPEDSSPNIEGTIDTNQEGNNGEDTVMEEENEGSKKRTTMMRGTMT